MSTNSNDLYQSGETPWNRNAPSPPLAWYFKGHPVNGRVLVPGCGAGHDAAFIASTGAAVVGLDIAPLAIEMARKTYPALPAEAWLLGDLFALPEDFTGAFDAVAEHTCLCALPPELRQPYRDVIHRVLKPGGLLVGVWFINPERDPGYEGPPHPLPLPELDALFAEGFEVIHDETPAIGYEGRIGRERLRVLRKR